MNINHNHTHHNKKESYLSTRKWVIIFAVSIMLITSLPYFLGYWVETNDPQNTWRFTGFIFGVEDGNSYIAKALTGMFGAWLFRTPYTVMPQKGVIAFLPYLLFGKLVSAPGTHEQLVALFHLFRFFAGCLSILATYDFIKYYVEDKRLCGLGLIMAILGGGLGWVLMLFGKSTLLDSLALEFYSPEAFGFLGIYGLPHVAMARAFLFWGIIWHLKAISQIDSPRYLDGLKIGCLWLGVALLQPLTAFIMGMVFGLQLLITITPFLLPPQKIFGSYSKEVGTRVKFLLVELIPVFPFFVYYLITYSTDAFIKIWSTQNIISSPHPLHYLLAYGLVLPFVFMGIISSIKQNYVEINLLVGWFIIAVLLAYAPVSIQRRLVEGIWVVLVVLMLIGYQWLEQKFPAYKFHWSLVVVTIMVLPSTLILLVGGVMTSLTPSEPIFRPNTEIVSFEFLSAFVRMDDVVMASYETGNVIPAYAPVRVLIGHGPESANLPEYSRVVESFYDKNTHDAERQAILERYDIRYVYWGPHEQELGDWNPTQALWLTSIFNLYGYSIFEVIEP